MNATPQKRPAHEAIYQNARDMILFGEFTPGQALTIMGLSEVLGAGVTPVREAIRRLTAEGALDALGNRRVCVPEMDWKRLEQIYLVRKVIEPELALRGAKNITKSGIAELERLDEEVNSAMEMGDARRYLEANYRFHFALYKHADAPILMQMAEALWLQSGPALRVVCGRFGTSNLQDQHFEATTALRRGDAEAAAEAIRQDILQGIHFVEQALGGKK